MYNILEIHIASIMDLHELYTQRASLSCDLAILLNTLFLIVLMGKHSSKLCINQKATHCTFQFLKIMHKSKSYTFYIPIPQNYAQIKELHSLSSNLKELHSLGSNFSKLCINQRATHSTFQVLKIMHKSKNYTV